MKNIKESTLVRVVDLEENNHKGSSQKPCITTSKHYATPDNLSQKLRLEKRTSLAEYFRHEGIIFERCHLLVCNWLNYPPRIMNLNTVFTFLLHLTLFDLYRYCDALSCPVQCLRHL